MSFQIQEPMPQAAHSSASPSQSYDLVVVGFGTTALSLATALADDNINLNVLFLESAPTFTWAPASVLPENAVRTSFLRDLITTRNPRSEFTFVNYLFESNQLVQFTNSSHMQPTRLVMGNYLSWVAGKMAERGWIRYSTTALSVKPVSNDRSRISGWNIRVRDAQGSTSTIESKRVVMATGSTPKVQSELMAVRQRVLHTSEVGLLLHNLKEQDIAIVGADQESAEIFEHLQCAGALHRVRASMYISDSALRPEDNTSFTQDIIDNLHPSLSTTSIPPELRPHLLSSTSTQPTPKISLHTIEALYENLYAQRITSPDPASWRFNMHPLSCVTGTKLEGEKIRLMTKNPRTGETKLSEGAFDVIIAAGGYAHATPLLTHLETAGLLQDKKVTVDGEYSVQFRRGVVSKEVGLWVLGSLEQGEVRDEGMAFAVERGKRVLESVIKSLRVDEESKAEIAML